MTAMLTQPKTTSATNESRAPKASMIRAAGMAITRPFTEAVRTEGGPSSGLIRLTYALRADSASLGQAQFQLVALGLYLGCASVHECPPTHTSRGPCESRLAVSDR